MTQIGPQIFIGQHLTEPKE